jgi:Zn-finger protein
MDIIASLSCLCAFLPIDQRGREEKSEADKVWSLNKCHLDRTQENRPKVHLIVLQPLNTSYAMCMVSNYRYSVSSPSVSISKLVSKRLVILL